MVQFDGGGFYVPAAYSTNLGLVNSVSRSTTLTDLIFTSCSLKCSGGQLSPQLIGLAAALRPSAPRPGVIWSLDAVC